MLLALPARIPGQMPLVPLYDENVRSGASHRVRAPGGYETWRIVAYDAKQDLLLYAAVHEGFQSDPLYIKAYRKYLRNPTRRPPPVPQDSRYEEVSVYQRGKRLAHSLRGISCSSVPISSAQQLDAGGSTLSFDAKPPASSIDASTFNSSHHWSLQDPLGSLRGRLALGSAQVDFDGVPVCRDHRHGPALPKLAQLIDGVAFFPDSAIFFLVTPTTSWMIRADRDGIRIIDQPLTVVQNFDVRIRRIRGERGITKLVLRLGDAGILKMDLAIQSPPARNRLFFAPMPDESIHGFCEISFPSRAWPLETLFAPRPKYGQPILTWSPVPPTDKSSPSAPEHAPAPSSSP